MMGRNDSPVYREDASGVVALAMVRQNVISPRAFFVVWYTKLVATLLVFTTSEYLMGDCGGLKNERHRTISREDNAGGRVKQFGLSRTNLPVVTGAMLFCYPLYLRFLSSSCTFLTVLLLQYCPLSV